MKLIFHVKLNSTILFIVWPTIWKPDNSDKHQYADQQVHQGDPPTNEKHIGYISTCDKITWPKQKTHRQVNNASKLVFNFMK